MAIFVGIYVMSFVGFLLHYYFKRPMSYPKCIELLLLYQLVFNLGCLGLLSFIGLTFMPQRAADELGWTICLFQQELANVNLGYGVVGFLAIWFRGLFWTATVISASIWLFGDGLHHFFMAFWDQERGLGTLGIIFYTDILIPVILVLLLYLYHQSHPHIKNWKIVEPSK